jgi:nicotinate-nucleotide adenylyltransferase
VDSLEALGPRDAAFVVGADEFGDFPRWKEPERVLELARLGVAARPGYPRAALDAVLGRLTRPERVEFFALEPFLGSSSEIRERVVSGESLDRLMPPAVAAEIERRGLYRPRSGLH